MAEISLFFAVNSLSRLFITPASTSQTASSLTPGTFMAAMALAQPIPFIPIKPTCRVSEGPSNLLPKIFFAETAVESILPPTKIAD